MRKILYYTWVGIGIIIGLPIVLLILFGTWVQSKFSKSSCKKCK
jgi:uncharacterized protein YneF (UPF0154 family)